MDGTRLNWSTLKYIHTSPRLLAWRVEHPRPETAALRLGRAIHCAALEPEAYPKRWIVAEQCAAITKGESRCRSQGSLYNGQWFCRVKGHAPEDAVEPRDFEVIDEKQAALVEICANSLLDHPVASKILQGGKVEERIEWTDKETGVECRGTLDYLKPDVVVDLKSTRQETSWGFAKDASTNLYHGQLGWYHDGGISAGLFPRGPELPIIISVSTVEPYDVAVYRLAKTTLEAGRILYRDLLNKYLQCRAASWWPGIAPDIQTLELPDWAPGMNGSEEEGSW